MAWLMESSFQYVLASLHTAEVLLELVLGFLHKVVMFSFKDWT